MRQSLARPVCQEPALPPRPPRSPRPAQAVRALLASGADASAREFQKLTPLHMAAAKASATGSQQLIELLLEKGGAVQYPCVLASAGNLHACWESGCMCLLGLLGLLGGLRCTKPVPLARGSNAKKWEHPPWSQARNQGQRYLLASEACRGGPFGPRPPGLHPAPCGQHRGEYTGDAGVSVTGGRQPRKGWQKGFQAARAGHSRQQGDAGISCAPLMPGWAVHALQQPAHSPLCIPAPLTLTTLATVRKAGGSVSETRRAAAALHSAVESVCSACRLQTCRPCWKPAPMSMPWQLPPLAARPSSWPPGMGAWPPRRSSWPPPE